MRCNADLRALELQVCSGIVCFFKMGELKLSIRPFIRHWLSCNKGGKNVGSQFHSTPDEEVMPQQFKILLLIEKQIGKIQILGQKNKILYLITQLLLLCMTLKRKCAFCCVCVRCTLSITYSFHIFYGITLRFFFPCTKDHIRWFFFALHVDCVHGKEKLGGMTEDVVSLHDWNFTFTRHML